MRIVKILIAEDEKPIRTGLKKMIDGFFQRHGGFGHSVQEAGNGRDAYRKCCSENFDILITDIKMPVLSGVSLAKRLAEEQPHIHILAVSGYQDYEYVREILKIGAYDYLLKPINENQLHGALRYFLDNLSNSPVAKTGGMQTEQRLIEHILLKSPDYGGELKAFLEDGQVNLRRCEIFWIRNDASSKNKAFELYYEVNKYGSRFPEVTIWQGELSSWIVLCLSEEFSPDFAAGLIRHAEENSHSVQNHFSLNSLSEASELYKNLAYAFYDLDSSPADGGVSGEFEVIQDIILGQGGAGLLEESINRVFAFYQWERTPLETINRDFFGLLYGMMSRSPDFIEFVSKSKFTRYDLAVCFENVVSLSRLRTDVSGAFVYLHRQMSRRQDSRKEDVFADAKAFIEKNYASDLQLSQVAEIVHLHPNYFSTQFREGIGMTFREYLRKVRIEAAKRYLRETGLHLDEIAALSGYNDSAHFFRAFKKVTGTTPKQYRNRRP